MIGDSIKQLLILAAGAAIGSAVTWKLVKTKYEQISKEEIASIKEYYHKKEEKYVKQIEDTTNDKPEEPVVNKDAVDYSKLTALYSSDSGPRFVNIKDVETSVHDEPYTIEPEEFDDLDDYEPISLIYFADGFLSDDHYELVDSIEDTVGYDALNRFGEYEEDAVYVRNDKRKCDYEILMDLRKYAELMQNKQEE